MEKALGVKGDSAERRDDQSPEDETVLKYLDATSEEVWIYLWHIEQTRQTRVEVDMY